MIFVSSAVIYTDAGGVDHSALVTKIHPPKAFVNKYNGLHGFQDLIDLIVVDRISGQIVHYDRILEYLPCDESKNERFEDLS